MYLPKHFSETDAERIASLIHEQGFATLVVQHEGRPFASHIPLLFDESAGSQGVLYGHLAKANPQCRSLAGGEALAIFHGPHAYVSPSWYATPGVPTWNFAVVHVRGRVRLIEDPQQAGALVAALTEKYDPEVADPNGPVLAADKWQAMLAGIVAFALDIEDIQAKFKLSQNRSIEDRQRVIAQLGQSDHPDHQAVAGLMLEDLVRAQGLGGGKS